MSNKEQTISDIVFHLRDWADRMPQDEDDGFWFERPCEQMQELLRGYADDIERAGKIEYERGFSDGKTEAQAHEINFLNGLLKEKSDLINSIPAEI